MRSGDSQVALKPNLGYTHDLMSQNPASHLILAYYAITPLDDPHEEVILHRTFLEDKDVKSRIYISEQGINGQMSASQEAAKAYIDWMHSRSVFADMPFKLHPYHEHVFPRLAVKYRQELVAVGQPVNLKKRGRHVCPEQWKQMLESGEHRLLIDVRNEYEWKVGRFEGAELPPCDVFRGFPGYAEQLKTRVDPKKTPIMMYCTGGIRCEIFSSILMEAGFENVYQLDGGVINYGEKVGSAHWLGKLFVFDDRLTVPVDQKETSVIGQCLFCQKAIDNYYNCANMDCNKLYLCCSACLETGSGCCSEGCLSAPRRRPYAHQQAHKPFRKWYHYAKHKEDLCKLHS